ncbi:hypothetical protein AAMO2058_001527600 [Amorphochlora amoebiformis]
MNLPRFGGHSDDISARSGSPPPSNQPEIMEMDFGSEDDDDFQEAIMANNGTFSDVEVKKDKENKENINQANIGEQLVAVTPRTSPIRDEATQIRGKPSLTRRKTSPIHLNPRKTRDKPSLTSGKHSPTCGKPSPTHDKPSRTHDKLPPGGVKPGLIRGNPSPTCRESSPAGGMPIPSGGKSSPTRGKSNPIPGKLSPNRGSISCKPSHPANSNQYNRQQVNSHSNNGDRQKIRFQPSGISSVKVNRETSKQTDSQKGVLLHPAPQDSGTGSKHLSSKKDNVAHIEAENEGTSLSQVRQQNSSQHLQALEVRRGKDPVAKRSEIPSESKPRHNQELQQRDARQQSHIDEYPSDPISEPRVLFHNPKHENLTSSSVDPDPSRSLGANCSSSSEAEIVRSSSRPPPVQGFFNKLPSARTNDQTTLSQKMDGLKMQSSTSDQNISRKRNETRGLSSRIQQKKSKGSPTPSLTAQENLRPRELDLKSSTMNLETIINKKLFTGFRGDAKMFAHWNFAQSKENYFSDLEEKCNKFVKAIVKLHEDSARRIIKSLRNDIFFLGLFKTY